MSPPHPLVSIALCTYNGEQHLERQLDTLINQDYPNLEIIVSDDRSTDETLRILERHGKQDPRIKICQNSENLGFIKNFQQAISRCTGKYIALCDQDDVWLPSKISTLVEAIGEHSLVYSKVQVVDKNERPLNLSYPSRNQLEGNCHMSLLLTNFVIGHTTLFKSNLAKHILPLPDCMPHDQWIAFVAACNGPGLKRVNEFLSLYRFHDSNVIANRKRSRSGSKNRKIKHQRHQQQFIEFAGLECLGSSDRDQIVEIASKHQDGRKKLFNLSLYRLLTTNAKSLLAAYKKPRRAAFRFCRS